MDAPQDLIGRPVNAIDTPALVVDLDAMDRNLATMARFAQRHKVRLRPHAKMHKSAELAKLQMAAGAVGVCVQKTSEAEAMVAGGVYNVFISNEVISPFKLARVAALTRAVLPHEGKIAICVDSIEGIRRLATSMNEARVASGVATAIDVFIEINVGQKRCGVEPGTAAVALALEIRKHPALNFAGLQAYHGKAQHLRSPAERREAITGAIKAAALTRQLIEAEGVSVGLVTGSGTGTAALEGASGVYGELQAGSYLFMDADYAANQLDPAQPRFEHALFVKTQVISTHTTGDPYVVCDAGHKSHAIDSGLPKVHAFSSRSKLEYFNGGDEHGILRPTAGSTRLPTLGSLLWLIPGHCDPTVNLHDMMIGVRGGLLKGVVERVIRVDARGALT
ncbi:MULTISPECIES: DSD1 family PLP-dependent enzyme [Polaromonas]|uniref:DSD1 family PLP-dependent enzyme n=1 Tax=Polaromonas aquatica TaxID=332657 RepID=A0ABW1TQL1_9BURK